MRNLEAIQKAVLYKSILWGKPIIFLHQIIDKILYKWFVIFNMKSETMKY